MGKHAEVEDVADVIIKSLSSKVLGVVASAAEAIAQRPAITQGLSKKAIAEALDPKSPPPEKVDPDKAVDPKVLEALEGAVARPLEEADAEIKVALAGAVGALKDQKARGFLLRLCGDRVAALRRAGRAALEKIDPPGKAPACTTIEEPGAASPLADASPVSKKVHLETDVGELVLALDTRFAPIAAMRIAELAASGFFDGTAIHRVVPGFVVQLGDPGGDGYGGAHSALRCETAPVPFAPGDIGIALAGRDTGSSQFFVMLGRAPHLDGSYAWIGHATGPWGRIAEGDVVIKARAE
jgi:cyclophilin family peptidyl-prolyl cis-trans isomerase